MQARHIAKTTRVPDLSQLEVKKAINYSEHILSVITGQKAILSDWIDNISLLRKLGTSYQDLCKGFKLPDQNVASDSLDMVIDLIDDLVLFSHDTKLFISNTNVSYVDKSTIDVILDSLLKTQVFILYLYL